MTPRKLKGRIYYYYYAGKWYTTNKLAALDECSVSHECLRERFKKLYENNPICGLDTFIKCLTTPALREKTGDAVREDTKEKIEWLGMMSLMIPGTLHKEAI